MTILDEILAHKRVELEAARARESDHVLAARAAAVDGRPRGFRQALAEAAGIAVIAEIKRRSPSKGLIREDFDPVAIARSYVEAGAACLSVLTDERFFGGSLEILAKVRAAVDRPLLRKDFVIDAYQIDEARVVGADCVLLIVAALDDVELTRLHAYARARGLDVLVEVHDEGELDRALAVDADLVGVNNRDLRTFEVDLATTERIAARLAASGRADDVLLVAESGIRDAADVARLARAGAAGFLVGESLMRQPDPGRALEALRRPS
ncbi:MAG: indole-3-glycerol phosphate synthase TrpC [Spirochaetaceae bacterium]|nr:indole-3-glycerol phosphate synthase TrpC [Myxococcales bacterium]MCB9722967.1 indole-3-glycerol phosphate synthase TrpC [Spirochaetaceae bacterium]HPG28080.1 indole-3-glycerol phosphate synthase TrpC [Myxococcota bacterium]